MLRWEWDEQCGTLELERGKGDEGGESFTYYLYQGNALLIALAEWEENGEEYYKLFEFWSDKEHMKNCLGLTKGHHNIHHNWKKITFFKDKIRPKDLNTICTALISAMPNITIEIKSDYEPRHKKGEQDA